MSESETAFLAKPTKEDSTFFGVSVRAWIAVIPISTVCFTYTIITTGVVVDAILTKDWSRVGTFANVGEPLYSLTIAAMAFYLGHRTSKTQ